MSDIDISKYAIGVLVARFQTNDLHDGHKYVIDQVVKNHKKVIIFLGVPKFVGTKKNPLDFDTRKKMIQQYYPDIVVSSIPDTNDNHIWAKELDKRIREIYPHGDVLLYGSRDSFIPYYHQGLGKFITKELDPLGTFTATDVRRLISEEVKNSIDFRSGVIYHAYNLYPRVIPTLTLIPFNSDKTKILISKKYNENSWKLISGFILPSDDTIELSGKRILLNKAGTNIESENYQYFASMKVEDWRFRGEDDKVMTTIMTCDYLWGQINPSDDISEIKWISIKELKKSTSLISLDQMTIIDKIINK